MNTYPSKLQDLEIKRRQLERQWQPNLAQRIRQTSINWMHATGQWLIQILTEGHQPKIWIKKTKQGHHWCAYDPSTSQYHQFRSEEAIRIWLEQRQR